MLVVIIVRFVYLQRLKIAAAVTHTYGLLKGTINILQQNIQSSFIVVPKMEGAQKAFKFYNDE